MNIGLLGAGTIGFGVVEITDKMQGMKVTRILDKRNIPGLEDRLTTDPSQIFNDPDIDTVVELLGGTEPAAGWAIEALEHQKNFVTANKLMVSEKLEMLLTTANAQNVKLAFSAAVGGGIPFLVNILRARRADRIRNIGGIINGTTNYILTRMQEEQLEFSQALVKAQELGYAEANPHADISGGDALCKIMLAACIAWDGIVEKKDIACEGIEYITASDVEKLKGMKLVCRLLARAFKTENGVCISVEPTLVRSDSMEAAVRLVENMIYWEGENAGVQRFTGAGAGRYATAYAVVNDLLDIDNDKGYEFSVSQRKISICNDEVKRRYLVRGLETDGIDAGDGYIITGPVAVSDMHNTVKSEREKGKSIFFAAMD